MTQQDDKSRRSGPRAPLQIDLSNHLYAEGGHEPIKCLGVDISRHGLGIVGFAALAAGATLVMKVNGKEIALKVVWAKLDPIRKNIHHIGLKTTDASYDLEKELQKAGLLKKIEAWQFPSHKRS